MTRSRAPHTGVMLGACAMLSLLLGACAKKDADESDAGEKAPAPVVAASTTKASVEPFTHTSRRSGRWWRAPADTRR